MTPFDAYSHTSARAWRLIRLHDGLVNIRQRSIRQDWAVRFKRFIGWRQSDSIQRVDSRDALIVLRDGAKIKPNDFDTTSLDDLLRSAVVLGVSGLDRYVHERVIKGIVQALRAGSLNRSQADFSIPAHLALEVTKELQRANRESRQLRPANEIRKKVQEIIHLRPFQSWREIEYAFELIGITGLTGKLQTLYQKPDIKREKEALNKIVARRNWIVHEGDLVRHKRGGNTNCHEIAPKFARGSLRFLDDLCRKLDRI